MDPRHKKRIETISNLFALQFVPQTDSLPYPDDEKTKGIINHQKEIDDLIKKHAPKFPIEKIAKTDLCILRLGIYELTIEKKLPHKVVINEAVELAKELSGEHSYGFINAVLGKVLQDYENQHPKS